MQGASRLGIVDTSTPIMAAALPDLPMDETVMVRLLRIALTGMTEYFEPVFRAMALSENGFHVLCLLIASAKGQASPSELSELVGTSRANITRILDGLEKDGLVRRRASERDARRFSISITAAGRRAVEGGVPKLKEPLQQAFDGLDETEQAALNALLRKLIVSFDRRSGSALAAA